MNDDYLWDRSGDDPDIKRLEGHLAVFRYQAIPAPDAFAPEPASARGSARGWALGFAFSAILTVVVGVGIWSIRPISERRSETAVDALPVEERVTNISPQTVRQYPSQAVPLVPSMIGVAERTAYRQPRRSVHRASRKSIAKGKRGPVELTPEERAAYDQVVLALAITSSKLRLVQEKVNGDHVGGPTAKENK
jgi:hypothetical protein